VRLLHRFAAYFRTMAKAKRNKNDLTRYIVRRPALAAAIAGYETAILVSNRVEPRLKYLASVRTSSLIGCPF
jgi:hypothetical protein